jgi:hypothetical protein
MVETMGPDSQRKSRSVRLGEATRGKLPSSKTTYRETIKAVIAFVVGRVAQEDTPGGAWGELMRRSDSRVRARNQIGQDEDTWPVLPLWEDDLTGM